MPRAGSARRGRKGPCVEYPPKVYEKLNAMIAESNKKEDNKYWQWVWLLILEASFMIFFPEIKNIAICAFLITFLCYPFFKESVNDKKENTPIVADKEIKLTLTVKSLKLNTSSGKIIQDNVQEFNFFVNQKDLNSKILLNKYNFQPIYEHPQCSGIEGVKPWYQNCDLVSGNKVLFSIGSLYCGTQIIVKNGKKPLLNEIVY